MHPELRRRCGETLYCCRGCLTSGGVRTRARRPAQRPVHPELRRRCGETLYCCRGCLTSGGVRTRARRPAQRPAHVWSAPGASRGAAVIGATPAPNADGRLVASTARRPATATPVLWVRGPSRNPRGGSGTECRREERTPGEVGAGVAWLAALLPLVAVLGCPPANLPNSEPARRLAALGRRMAPRVAWLAALLPLVAVLGCPPANLGGGAAVVGRPRGRCLHAGTTRRSPSYLPTGCASTGSSDCAPVRASAFT